MRKYILVVLFLFPIIGFAQTCDNEVVLVQQLTTNDQETVGDTAGNQRHSQYFNASTTYNWLGKIVVQLGKWNSPTDSIVLDFKRGLTTSSLTSLVSTTISYTALATYPTFTTYEWILTDDIPLNSTTTYWLEFYRTGSLDNTNNYVFKDQTTGNPFPFGGMERLVSGTWTELPNRDFYFKLSSCDLHSTSTTSTIASSTIATDIKEMTYTILVFLVFLACGYYTYRIIK